MCIFICKRNENVEEILYSYSNRSYPLLSDIFLMNITVYIPGESGECQTPLR